MAAKIDKYLPIRRSDQNQVKNQKQNSAQVSTNESDRSTSEELAFLRTFDLNSTYGPTIGVSRLDRWERAKKFGLSPPPDVPLIINKHPNDQKFSECLWKRLE